MGLQLSTDYDKFYINGKSSEWMNLYLITTESESSTSITGLSRNLVYSESDDGIKKVVNVTNNEIKFNIQVTRMINGSNGTFEIEDIDRINRWLMGDKNIKELRVGNRIFYGYFTKGEKWIRGDREGYLLYEFVVPEGCMFIEGKSHILVNKKETIELKNISTAEDCTDINIEISNIKSDNVKIINTSNGDFIKISNTNSNQKIIIFSDYGEIYDENNTNVNLFKDVEYGKNFPRLNYGFNIFEIEGSCEINFYWKNRMCL